MELLRQNCTDFSRRLFDAQPASGSKRALMTTVLLNLTHSGFLGPLTSKTFDDRGVRLLRRRDKPIASLFEVVAHIASKTGQNSDARSRCLAQAAQIDPD